MKQIIHSIQVEQVIRCPVIGAREVRTWIFGVCWDLDIRTIRRDQAEAFV